MHAPDPPAPDVWHFAAGPPSAAAMLPTARNAANRTIDMQGVST
jgi:hypothetical protein